MSEEYVEELRTENVIYTVVPMSYEVFAEIETIVAKKLRKNEPAYDYYVDGINKIFAGNPKLVGVLERGEVVELSKEDVADLVSVIDLHMNNDNLMRRAIYHEGVLSGIRMIKDNL